jgi:hypothetical protein
MDATLNDVTEVAIFEMKAAWLREDAIVDETHENFLRDIRAKYGALPESGEREKGVAQLARSIGALARGEWLGMNGEYREAQVLYPVLVVHDTRMDAPALGNFLAGEFVTLLGPIPAGKHVAPLTVMTINDLENMESSVGHPKGETRMERQNSGQRRDRGPVDMSDFPSEGRRKRKHSKRITGRSLAAAKKGGRNRRRAGAHHAGGNHSCRRDSGNNALIEVHHSPGRPIQ